MRRHATSRCCRRWSCRDTAARPWPPTPTSLVRSPPPHHHHTLLMAFLQAAEGQRCIRLTSTRSFLRTLLRPEPSSEARLLGFGMRSFEHSNFCLAQRVFMNSDTL